MDGAEVFWLRVKGKVKLWARARLVEVLFLGRKKVLAASACLRRNSRWNSPTISTSTLYNNGSENVCPSVLLTALPVNYNMELVLAFSDYREAFEETDNTI